MAQVHDTAAAEHAQHREFLDRYFRRGKAGGGDGVSAGETAKSALTFNRRKVLPLLKVGVDFVSRGFQALPTGRLRELIDRLRQEPMGSTVWPIPDIWNVREQLPM